MPSEKTPPPSPNTAAGESRRPRGLVDEYPTITGLHTTLVVLGVTAVFVSIALLIAYLTSP